MREREDKELSIRVSSLYSRVQSRLVQVSMIINRIIAPGGGSGVRGSGKTIKKVRGEK